MKNHPFKLNLNKILEISKQIKEELPPKKRLRFEAGLMTISLNRHTSINELGRRLSPESINTGISRLRRALGDGQLIDRLQGILIKRVLGSARGQNIYVNLDHSNFGANTVACFALQTSQGRSIPFIIQANKGQNNAAITPLIEAIELLLETVPAKIRPKLVLTMDRWFGSERIMKLLDGKGVGFIVRTKTDKILDLPWGQVKIREISHIDLKTYHSITASGPKHSKKCMWFSYGGFPKLINRICQ